MGIFTTLPWCGNRVVGRFRKAIPLLRTRHHKVVGRWPLAEFERDLIVERTKAGMDAARKRGQHIGRPKKLDHTQIEHAKELIDQGKSRNEVARILSVNPLPCTEGFRLLDRIFLKRA